MAPIQILLHNTGSIAVTTVSTRPKKWQPRFGTPARSARANKTAATRPEPVQGYYDNHPSFVPERPISLIGFPGAEVPRVARAISMTTGLPLIELERWIEHESGKSIPQLVLEDGSAGIHDIQTELLKRALRSQPPAVIALGHRAMERQEDQRLILEQSTCFYVRRTIFELFQVLRHEVEEYPARYAEFIMGPPESVQDLKSMYDEHETEFLTATYVVDTGGKNCAVLGAEILDQVKP